MSICCCCCWRTTAEEEKGGGDVAFSSMSWRFRRANGGAGGGGGCERRRIAEEVTPAESKWVVLDFLSSLSDILPELVGAVVVVAAPMPIGRNASDPPEEEEEGGRVEGTYTAPEFVFSFGSCRRCIAFVYYHRHRTFCI